MPTVQAPTAPPSPAPRTGLREAAVGSPQQPPALFLLLLVLLVLVLVLVLLVLVLLVLVLLLMLCRHRRAPVRTPAAAARDRRPPLRWMCRLQS